MRFNLTRPLRDFLSPSVASKGLWVSKNTMLSMTGGYAGLAIFVFLINKFNFVLNWIFYTNLNFSSKYALFILRSGKEFNRKENLIWLNFN